MGEGKEVRCKTNRDDCREQRAKAKRELLADHGSIVERSEQRSKSSRREGDCSRTSLAGRVWHSMSTDVGMANKK